MSIKMFSKNYFVTIKILDWVMKTQKLINSPIFSVITIAMSYSKRDRPLCLL